MMMTTREFLAHTAAAALGLCAGRVARAQASTGPFIRWADLDIDPAQLDAFKAAARVHGEAVLRTEPGVRAFHAVSEAEKPARVRVFEMYDDADAYQAHTQQAHFREFRDTTAKMITGRQLHDMVPVRLGAKARLTTSPLARIAEIEIDPARLQAYEAAVSEEIDDSIRLELGVLTIYAVGLANQRNQLRFLEIYADEPAYRQHLDSPHFKKYVETTKSMIKARKLFEARPLFLGLKPR